MAGNPLNALPVPAMQDAMMRGWYVRAPGSEYSTVPGLQRITALRLCCAAPGTHVNTRSCVPPDAAISAFTRVFDALWRSLIRSTPTGPGFTQRNGLLFSDRPLADGRSSPPARQSGCPQSTQQCDNHQPDSAIGPCAPRSEHGRSGADHLIRKCDHANTAK
jgi:hypothetical protein